MKRIIVAPDKFKGSLTGIEFCNAVERGIKKVVNDMEIVKLPLADGGDGTVEALQFYVGGDLVKAFVNDPLMRQIEASYLYSASEKMAFIEMAEASGIRLLKTDELNPLQTSTFGTGELILDAIERGVQQVILGIGGSSTNDAGIGMAKALGFRFFNSDENELSGKGEDLNKLAFINASEVHPKLKSVRFKVACDVDNPLYGPNGAAYIYSPQKGASPKIVEELDRGLQNFNKVVKEQFGKDFQSIPGAGAAGGLGAGCILFLNAELNSGTSLIKEVAGFEKKIVNADWIITGEGKFDEQTFSGKVIKGVLESRTNQKLAVFCGISELNENQLKEYKIDYLSEMMEQALDPEDSIKNSGRYLENAAEEFARNFL